METFSAYHYCSSKVLVVGGYSILDPKNAGFVITTSARFYSFFAKDTTILLPIAQQKIYFRCPQLSLSLYYSLWIDKEGFHICEVSNQQKNSYVEAALEIAFKVLLNFVDEKSLNISGILTVLEDNSFFTTSKSEIDGSFKTFDLNHSCKTGLGSSACVIIAILRALLFDSLKDNLKMNEIIEFSGALANYIAQRKIGSGFDIAASVFGNILFQRRPAEKIQSLAGKEMFQIKDFDLQTPQPLQVDWSFYEVSLMSVKRSTNTVESVGSMTAFLNANESLKTSFYGKSNETVTKLIESFHDKNKLKIICNEYRQLQKEMGQQSRIEIEPDSMSAVICYLMEQEYIYFSVCPGAGGYDAIFILHDKITDKNKISKLIEQLFLWLTLTKYQEINKDFFRLASSYEVLLAELKTFEFEVLDVTLNRENASGVVTAPRDIKRIREYLEKQN